MLNIPLFREQLPTLRTCLPSPAPNVSACAWETLLHWIERCPGPFMGCNLPLKTFVRFMVVLGLQSRKEGGRDRLDLGTA